jgi:rhamnosyltransferase
MKKPKISVIIRTKNEETWVAPCLDMVFRQDYPDFEVILVDNESTDHTLEIVRRYPVKEVVKIDRYKPGLALNMGIRASTGGLIACLSSHCIPRQTDWLSSLASALDDPKVAGVYGRQLPLAFSGATDKRDLLTVFGLDRRVQVKDYFFHNANSMLRRDLWEACPFDEEASNIEDRLWGKAMIDAGHTLVYEPGAAVYHHHGINQGDSDRSRAHGVSLLLDRLEADIVADLPENMRPENCNVVAIAPVLGEPRELQGGDVLTAMLRQLTESRYLRRVYTLAESDKVKATAERLGAHFLRRPEALRARERTLGEILQYALQAIEANGDYPDTILYVNYLCPFRPPGLLDELVTELHYKGLDTVFPGYVDYNDHWVNAAAERFQRISESPKPGPERPRLYRSLYGLGCATRSAVVRKGELIGEKVGIVPLSEHIYTLRLTDQRPQPISAEEAEREELLGWTSQMFLREFRP